ncbi:MAG TPA: glycosyltransferase family 1 protein, partial [Candidatus Saccharimonas sp.]|nr:glycosyltransferase family 1 protein [Candidatus Saccharimonas sp.]
AGRWARASTLVVTDSQTSRQEILDHYKLPADKVKAIYCGVDESFKPATKADVAAVRKKYAITKPYLFFLSNLEPRKNIARLIQSLSDLPVGYKAKYCLVLVGGMGWQNDEIVAEITKAQAAGWEIIKPKAYVPDNEIPALLTGAEVLVHPALHEGFGIPVVEAMACRTPVVASDIPVLQEIAGDAAVYADTYNTADIAAKINQVLTDVKLRQKLVDAGEKTARQFTWAAAADQLLSYSKGIRP